jgi:hypothetical protein
VHDFDEAIPNFTALSYAWSSPSDAKMILVTGFPTRVRSNLYVALTHLRSAEKVLIFWIDALCINQKNCLERNSHVRLMGDIYMVAQDVVAFLSSATPGVDPDDKSEVYLDIATRPYWSRLWIIQECVLGRNVILQRGHHSLDWDSFCKELPKDVSGDETHMLRLFDFKRTYQADQCSLDIAAAILLGCESEATEPHDRVYGVLGLVQVAPGSDIFRPDYTSSVCELYRETISYIREYESSNMKMKKEKKCHKKCDGQRCGAYGRLIDTCWSMVKHDVI